ncbi:MAG: hypothetical protein ABSB59_01530 [Streptosporangiaceae bacterium]
MLVARCDEFVEHRWERLTGGFAGSYGSAAQQRGDPAVFDPVALKALMECCSP